MTAHFMNIRQTLFKLASVLTLLSSLTGCVVWTGGIPSSYRDREKYPILASVHGIKEVTYSNDLQRIGISYTPTNEITRDTNTTHGWLIQIQPAERPIKGVEFYVLPKAARWGSQERPPEGIVSLDKTTCVKYFVLPKGAKYVGDEWGMFADDPLGEYQITVFLDKRLAADFRFRVIEEPKPATPPKDQYK
jgi:hypothetical protein